MNKRRPRRPLRRSGMTLVEIMIAAGIFGIMAVSIFSVARTMYRTAMRNLADGVSLHAAEGMLEQIRVIPYSTGNAGVPGLRELSGSSMGVTLPYFVAGKAEPQTQTINVNSASYMPFTGASISGKLDPKTKVLSQSSLDLQVRILVNERATDVNFGAGVTIEVYYQYRVYATDAYVTRVLRTFVGRGVS